MNLRKLIFTENDCYKSGRKIKPTGIMVHSTGANNPRLKRYVGPDDGLLGENTNGNHWNRPGTSKCVHAFIGKLEDGTIATYQVLPWDHRGRHAGGDANNTHIGFEICEDGLTDPVYFGKIYQEAVDLCVYLCKMFGLTEKDIIDHSEGRALGLASNHGDVKHWFPKHGKSMDTLRADVKAQLAGTQTPKEPVPKEPELVGTIYRVQVGAFSKKANAVRKQEAVKAAGFEDAMVVSVDGNLWRVQVGAYAVKDNAVRMQVKLAEAGFTGFVTRLSGKIEEATPETTTSKKSVEEVAREVIRGKWGNGAARRENLTAAGYDYTEVQAAVNRLMK